ncbi:hypothetical protein DPEC_G00315920 [Dallia pectoralis]|uniref:Uncharacterized protein n=1 Tax=Dallia pectoralis TaxID=75939 RepID=A0ACC2FCK9_DALPE|nr:hypothetical protein DPEC_G00315920 [Dallia pectoralis]
MTLKGESWTNQGSALQTQASQTASSEEGQDCHPKLFTMFRGSAHIPLTAWPIDIYTPPPVPGPLSYLRGPLSVVLCPSGSISLAIQLDHPSEA